MQLNKKHWENLKAGIASAEKNIGAFGRNVGERAERGMKNYENRTDAFANAFDNPKKNIKDI